MIEKAYFHKVFLESYRPDYMMLEIIEGNTHPVDFILAFAIYTCLDDKL